MPDAPDLLPCPFCDAHLVHAGGSEMFHRTEADTAACVLSGHTIWEYQYEAWNTRTDDALKAENERLREALGQFYSMSDGILADVKSAHLGRGDAASEWMREDDRDFIKDLRKLIENVAALAPKEGE